MAIRANPLLLGGTSLSSGLIPKSFRARGSSTVATWRQFPTAGNRKQWTWSGWVKRGQLGSYQVIFGAHDNLNNNDNNYLTIAFASTDAIGVSLFTAWVRQSNRVFRDKHAWMHVVVAYDTPNATAQNRCRIWVNGVEITSWAQNNTITQNIDHGVNAAQYHGLGRVNYDAAPGQGDMLIADVHFIDGLVLDPTAFGQFSPTTGQWVPKAYTGTYPLPNSFHLDFNTDWTSGATISGWSNPVNYTTPGSYNWQIPSNIYDLQASAWGAGGGGGCGADSGGGVGNTGGLSNFYNGTYIAYGGTGGIAGYGNEGGGGTGGATSGNGDTNTPGNAGGGSQSYQGGYGAGAPNAGGNVGGNGAGSAGSAGSTPGGGGGGGGGWAGVQGGGGGGGSGAFIQKTLTKASGALVPGANFSLTVGQGGAADTGGTYAGGAGANGQVSITYRTESGGQTYKGMADVSGNGNHWTPNNYFRTDSVYNDLLTDSPNDNCPPVSDLAGGYNDFWAGTCGYNPNASWGTTLVPVVIPPGKWFFEGFNLTLSGAAYGGIGVRAVGNVSGVEYLGDRAGSYGIMGSSAALTAYTGGASSGAITRGFSANVAFACAIDTIAGKIWLGGGDAAGGYSWVGGGNPDAGTNPTFTFTPGTDMVPGVSMYANTTHWNVGGHPAYTTLKPSTFKWFRAGNFDTPAITDPRKHFLTKLWAGDGTVNRDITGFAFSPDFVWTKTRLDATNHLLFDTTRGPTKAVLSNTASLEQTVAEFVQFNADGFRISQLADNSLNVNGRNYASWSWDEGVVPGLDIVSYTGTGVQRTVPHGLGAAPDMISIKALDGGYDWWIYHKDAGRHSSTPAENGGLSWNGIGQFTTGAQPFAGVAPTATEFTLAAYNPVNWNTGKFIAYVWRSIPGFSKFGRYVGNGSALGTFVPTGFKPAYVMVKRVDSTGDWIVYDNQRDPVNPVMSAFFPNSTAVDYAAVVQCDFCSNGFKLRTSGGSNNLSGASYVYMAFAEAPYQYATAR